MVPTNGRTATPGAPTPNIILTNYTYGDKVSAGQVFPLNMEFMNTSQGTPIENVVISLETGEGLSINSSSNTFYVPKMGPCLLYTSKGNGGTGRTGIQADH